MLAPSATKDRLSTKTPAIAIHFLQEDHVSIELPQDREHRLVRQATLDVPRHDGELAIARWACFDARRFTRDPMNLLVAQPRVGEETEKPEAETHREAQFAHVVWCPSVVWNTP